MNHTECTEYILANARVVSENHVCSGSVQVIDGRIAAVDCGPCRTREKRLDMDGDLLLPGLIEVHTDNLEKHLIPRPGVIWPSAVAAILAHDIQLSGAGITTVFNALRSGRRAGRLPDIDPRERLAAAQNRLNVKHFFHILSLRQLFLKSEVVPR
jgi:alpha-D-ribose 1-methylphosphonate 5-triphosphate diphosphatase